MSNSINFRQVFAKKKRLQDTIKAMCPKANNQSGIYVFYRVDQNGIKYAYIGKAEHNLLYRMSDHLNGYNQHIDLSIRKHGLYDKVKRPYGYQCGVIRYCLPSQCNYLEQYYIKEWADKGYQMRNTQSGGSAGRTNINDNKSAKGYYEGIARGQEKAYKEIKVFFDKYLDFVIKGKPNKIKERKLAEFTEILGNIDKEKENGNIDNSNNNCDNNNTNDDNI